jgi:hypothetical protein
MQTAVFLRLVQKKKIIFKVKNQSAEYSKKPLNNWLKWTQRAKRNL